MVLKFYTYVEKGSKLKVIKFLRLIPAFVEVTKEKLIEGPFYQHHPLPLFLPYSE